MTAFIPALFMSLSSSFAQFPVSSFNCHADMESFPLIGTVSVADNMITVEKRSELHASLTQASFQARKQQGRSSYIWRAPLSQELVIALKPSRFKYHNGTYIYLENGQEVFVSLFCYPQEQR